MLWLDTDPGVDEDFAALGGHSLLSAQLFVEVEKALDRALPDTVLGRLTTIAAMAEAIEQDAVASRSPARDAQDDDLDPAVARGLLLFTASWRGVRTRPDALVIGRNVAGTRPPLFWCMQREQELSQLERYLGPDRPVWGMRSEHKVAGRDDASLDRIAARYAREIADLLSDRTVRRRRQLRRRPRSCTASHRGWPDRGAHRRS